MTDPARAYFVTPTRLWELGVGALVAVGAPVWRSLPARVGAALSWAGLALIGIGLVVQSTTTPWPGSAALVPVLGAAAVILGGHSTASTSGAASGAASGAPSGAASGAPRGAGRLLGIRPMVWIGGLSYSLYLWHWPLVVAANHLFGGLRPWQGALVVASSVIPAWLSNRLIENPLRFHPAVAAHTRNALVLGLVCSLLGVGAGALLTRAGDTSGFAAVDPVTAPASRFGAGVLGTGPVPDPSGIDMSPTAMTPDPLKATSDAPRLYADNCQTAQTETAVFTCTYGVKGSTKVLAMVGDSKIAQWFPALEKFATTHGWELRTYLKSACPWSPALIYGGMAPDKRFVNCQRWGASVLARLTGPEKPTAVITSGIRRQAYGPDGVERESVMVDGYVDYWTRLGRLGVPVIAVMDTPQPGKVVYECVLDHPRDLMTKCKGDFNDGSGGAALVGAVARVPTSRLIDLDPWVCPDEQCWPVIGGVLVWRQGSHITATYAATVAPALDRLLSAALTQVGIPAS